MIAADNTSAKVHWRCKYGGYGGEVAVCDSEQHRRHRSIALDVEFKTNFWDWSRKNKQVTGARSAHVCGSSTWGAGI